VLVVLEDALEASKAFLNPGSDQEPDLGDLYVYGVLRGLEGLAIHNELMDEYKSIPLWYEKMKDIVEDHRGKE
jgi:hypothetical protein